MVRATFRFYEVLNDFLPSERRQRAFDCECARAATAKHMIEALGVPHTEVALVLLNGQPCTLAHRPLHEGDRVSVYPTLRRLAPAGREAAPPRFMTPTSAGWRATCALPATTPPGTNTAATPRSPRKPPRRRAPCSRATVRC